MSDATTIARPYAKAIFKHALAANLLSAWAITLHDLAQIVLDPDCKHFICNPASTTEQQVQLLLAICTKTSRVHDLKIVESLVRLLAANRRLLVLPDIYIRYEALQREQEKTLVATVSSYTALTGEQQQQLINSLTKRLQRQVTLEVTIDKSLLGGAIIRADDLVIDGSVRGKLNKLKTNLAA